MADLNIVLTVRELRTEAAGVLSIVFERPNGFTYEPGDWMDIRFPTPEFPVGKTYSFASAPTESELLIAFKVGVSPFKQALASVQPGDTMLITQYGTNGFRHDKRKPSLFIAGGVGITPFRSMIRSALDHGTATDVELVYLNRSHPFAFSRELDDWKLRLSGLSVHFVATADEGRLTARSLARLVPDIASRRVYIAGSPAMVTATSTIVRTLGVKYSWIKIDSFDGY